jgi:hypothetical protein
VSVVKTAIKGAVDLTAERRPPPLHLPNATIQDPFETGSPRAAVIAINGYAAICERA